jgi:glutathione synthase
MNEDHLKVKHDSTNYVVRTLKSKCPQEFDVQVSTKANPELAKDADIVFCRFEFPIKPEFLRSLSKYDDGTKTFINPPSTKLNYADKSYFERFIDSGLLPETIISQDASELAYFMQQTKPKIVSKPLGECGGKGIRKIELNGESISELEKIARELTEDGKKKMILQRFIEEIEQSGDKRINIIFGEPVSTRLMLPKKGNFLCNFSTGGRMVPTTITKQDYRILEQIQEFIEKERIKWAGIDVIGPYLGEINIASPGDFYRADVLNGDTKGVDTLIRRLKNL